MANIFLDANDSFTQASTNTNDAIFGRSGGTETVILQGNPTGTTLDGNVEVVQLAGTAAGTTLQVNATTGRLELVSGGTVFATFSGGLNQAVNLQFTDGNVTLTQTGANAFTIANPTTATNNVTINPTTPQTGSAVTLGADKSTAGTTTAPVAGQTFALTSAVESTFGTSGNDTFTGVDGSTYQTGDVIVDGSSTDNDTLTVSATAAFAATPTVAGIENIILNQTSAAAAGANLVGINGGSVTLNQLQAGANGGAAVTNAGGITLTMGTGITGATTVGQTANTNLIINAGSATGVTQSGGAGKGSVTINGGTSTTTAVGVATTGSVTLNGDALTTLTGTGKTISASTKADASTIKLTGVGTSDAATLVIGKAATIDNDGNAVETLSISAANAVTGGSIATITDLAATTYNLTGTNAVTLANTQVTSASLFSGKTVTTDGAGTHKLEQTLIDTALTADYTKVAAGVAIDIKGTANAGTKFAVANNATVNATADLTADLEINGVEATKATNVLNLGVSADQTAGITVTNTSTVNLAVTKNSDLSDLKVGTATVTASGSGNLILDTGSIAKSLDATAMTGSVTATADEGKIATITGGSGNDTITIVSDKTVTVNGGAGTGDEIKFGANSTKATFSNFETGTLAGDTTFKASQLDGVAMVLNGAHKVKVDGTATMDQTTLDLSKFVPGTITGFEVIVDGAGDLGAAVAAGTAVTITGSSIADTITLTHLSGNNTVSSGAGDDKITMGAGNDTVTAGEGADVIDVGAGTNTVNVSETTAAEDVIKIGSTGTDTTTIIGFDFGGTATDDDIEFDISDIKGTAAPTNLVNGAGTDVADTNAVAVLSVTAAGTDIGAGTANLFTLGGNYASSDALKTALETGGSLELVFGDLDTIGDAILVAYDNGVDTFIATVTTSAAITDGAKAAANTLTVANYVTLVGVTDATSLVAGDFDAFVA